MCIQPINSRAAVVKRRGSGGTFGRSLCVEDLSRNERGGSVEGRVARHEAHSEDGSFQAIIQAVGEDGVATCSCV